MQPERRRYFRIQDSILLQASAVSGGELERKLEEFRLNHQQFSSTQNLNLNLVEQLADLQAIQEQMPELGRYLVNLQRQVDRLTAVTFADEATPQKQEKQVSLSAQGISFLTDESFQPVDVVELALQLTPSGIQMQIYSRVVLVEENEGNFEQGRYRVSLDFEHIHNADRETLIKHIHSKQLQELGSKHNVAL